MLVWPIASAPLGVAIALVSTLPIVWRRSPWAAFVGTLPWLVPADGFVVLGYVAAFVLYYSLAVYRARPWAMAVFGVAASVAGSYVNHVVPGEYAGAISAVVLPVLTGRLVRHQRAQNARLLAVTEELEHERERTAQLAVAEERARIARELHDVVAHGLSVIAIQADGAEAALERDPSLARAPLRAIRRSAEEALGEMRRLLGVLREAGDEPELAPQPGLAQLPTLVERARAAGMPVTLHVDGTPRPLPASVDLSAFRIVQEALTNVHKHARGELASVKIVWRLRSVAVQIRNTGEFSPGNDGHGLVGMRERVKLHGGELHAGELPGGGFEVSARLPL